ncbi:colanic acid biosynthesis acetyltransferase WcaF [Alteromonas australica]|jgi:putative colanic acid biosynthesis acetyltransferase WcaF|uniref:colanic acid biosynthesis acetyltransferase WcaF n=1 Tax=Alteromonas australica TaxID=589873 RepID=UPI000C5F61F8|nr:colanic acid biosynthesis acetyltransferase WcaF [Alteromonas australica]MAE01594.1 putative colanic acid biosynthesis acetyltransferase [Pseudoalteromonas sp.]|tara:strand:- start:4224 stop:4775 length:552 start_codon:yes stop_codon:yes gene_type:complete
MIKQGINPYTQASFSLQNRLARLIWGMTYLIFIKFSPRPMHRYRAFLLTLFGAKLGKDCHIYPTAKIWAPWNLKMEDEACIANDTIIYNMAMITIGEKAVVSQGAHLCCGTHDYTDKNFQLYALPITIGANAWLCTECFVGPGITIGTGAVIGARTVLFKDAEAWVIYAGNPAKAIKKRIIKN